MYEEKTITLNDIFALKDKPMDKILQEPGYRNFSVLIPIAEIDSEPHLLFELRSENLFTQPGEICFPGGRIETSETPLAAALRETYEELLVPQGSVEVIREMPVMVTPFGTILHTFLGRLETLPDAPNPSEVSEYFTVPIRFFLENPPAEHGVHVQLSPAEGFPYHVIQNGSSYKWGKGSYPVYFYFYEGRVIWGMTAKLVHELVAQLVENKHFPW